MAVRIEEPVRSLSLTHRLVGRAPGVRMAALVHVHTKAAVQCEHLKCRGSLCVTRAND